MNARIQAALEALGNQFWLRPAVMVVLCVALAQGAVWIETAHVFGGSTPAAGPWGYSGGAEGARALLSAVASSAIGVAGTIFSITIAALSLASGQMGPRLLRNFIRDSRNQFALGIFVGTFAYALIVLRTVRTQQEGAFIPHAAVTIAIILALVCTATLVWFVHHVATSINVEKVVDAVHNDLVAAIQSGTLAEPGITPVDFIPGREVSITQSNYLQAIDLEGLADWASRAGVRVRLRFKPGEYVPVGCPVADIHPFLDGASIALDEALTFGRSQAALQDLEYCIRQLSEIAVRALSPGINDPLTATSVLERFGDALCRISTRFLPSGAVARDGQIVLLYVATAYGGLCDVMFDLIRQNATTSSFVLIRMLDVLIKVAQVERMPDRLIEIVRHAELVRAACRSAATETSVKAEMDCRWLALEKATQN